MEAVDVLLRREKIQKARAGQVGGEGELDEDPVDVGIAVEALKKILEAERIGSLGQATDIGDDPRPRAGFLFAGHVDGGGGVVADENGDEAGGGTVVSAVDLDTRAHLGFDTGGETFAVEEIRGHGLEGEKKRPQL